MLSGVGGRTLAEAAENLSEEEFQIWALYRRMRGSFNQGTRLEVEFAKLRQLHISVNSSRGAAIPSLEDLMQHATYTPEDGDEKPDEDLVVIPFAAAAALLGFRSK